MRTQDYDCGCVVKIYDDDSSPAADIEYCDLHLHAGELLAASEELVANLIKHAHFGLNEYEVGMLKRAETAIARATGGM